jgi:DNA-binding MarR family transcriptional regulator
MSTVYSEFEQPGPDGLASPTPETTSAADLADPADPMFPSGPGYPDSPEELAAAATTFAGAFERWASRKAVVAGASAPRLRLLNAVHCHGPQKMADLADALAVTPRNVTALVDGLESDGLVRRVPHSTDRRITLVELTGGSDRVAEQFGTYQASIASLFADMTADERQTLHRLLGSLLVRMRADAACVTAAEETPNA